MPTTTVIATPSPLWKDWRHWPANFSALWRRSLRFRTLLTTLALTSFAILVTCVAMALAIQNSLWESRKNQVLEDAQRAVYSAQTTLNFADVQGDRTALQALMRDVRVGLQSVSSSERIGVFRIDSTPSVIAPTDFVQGSFSESMISAPLRQRVVDHAGTQWWQPIELTAPDGTAHAGIIIGQQLNVPDAGAYAVYIAYDLGDTEATLLLVQRGLWFAGIVLIAMIAVIAWGACLLYTSPSPRD